MDLDKDSLKIGDYVYLRDVNLGCYLSVEGIISEDLVGVQEIVSLEDSLFCIHLQRQYSAFRELNAFLEGYGMDKNKITDEGEISYYQALERGRDNENVLNEMYLKKKNCQVVLFGDIIQLYHVKSRKYLQVLPGKLAKQERENIRVALDVNGSIFSWIQICPRFKIDKEGDRILTNTEVFLKVPERANEYIHVAERDTAIDHDREINCSLEMSSFRLTIYQSSTDTLHSHNLLASQIVYITDPETGSCLTIAQQRIESLDEDEEGEEQDTKEDVERSVAGQSEGDGEGEKHVDLLGSLSKSNSKHEADTGDEAEEDDDKPGKFFHEFGDLVFEPMQNHINSNFLWFLETSSRMLGGPISWKTDLVRLKHMNTGKYLMAEKVFSDEEVDDEKSTPNCGEKIIFTAVEGGENLSSTLFNIYELTNGQKNLENGKAIQIGHDSTWLDRGRVIDGTTSTFVAWGIKDQLSAVNLIIQRFGHPADEPEESEAKNSKETLDVFAGQSARVYLSKFCDMIEIPEDSTGSSSLWPKGNRSDVDLFKAIVDKTILFSQGFSMSATHVKIHVDKADPAIRTMRQNLLREQGTLEVVIRMIHKLIPICNMQEAGVSEDVPLIRMGNHIIHSAFSILYYSIIENPDNQIYVADFMPVLLAHLSCQPLAGKCVTEMLSKNLELQETKIGTREIKIFVDKLRNSKMNSMYLNLLQSCCSCEGDGVDANQCKVATMLFDGNTEDIIMGLFVDFNNCKKVSWEAGSELYLNASVASEAVIRGDVLLTKGLPSLYVTWTEMDSDKNMQKYAAPFEVIFGRSELQEAVYSQSALPPEILLITDLKTQKKKKLGHYFVAQMFLGAEMSMDRNYVAMHKMDEIFSFESLLTMIKLNVRFDVQSAAVRLLMCQYIDRDPQACSKIPCLTRTWGDIKKHDVPQLPYVDSRRRHVFGLVQTLVSEHISKMAGNRWDERSLHILKLLKTMVEFNFYGTNEKMKDLIAPLLSALDRRSIIFSDEVSVGSSRGDMTSRVTTPLLTSNSLQQAAVIEDDDKDDNSSLSSENETTLMTKGQKFLSSRGVKCVAIPVRPFIDYSFIILTALAIANNLYFFLSDLNGNTTLALNAPEFIIEIVLLFFMLIELQVAIVAASRERGGLTQFKIIVFALDFASIAACFVLLCITVRKVYMLVIVIRLARLVLFVTPTTSVESEEGGEEEEKLEAYKAPVRYAMAPMSELETMVEAVNILAFVLRVIEDRNISLLLRNFYNWESGSDKRAPSELFEQAITDSTELSLAMDDFDFVMTDVLMFSHPPLTQSTLEVLMAHYSQRRNLLTNARGVQLLASKKREKQYRLVDQMLQELEQNAETQELWGELETDQDREQSRRTKEILTELTEICKVRSYVLEFGEDFLPDVDVQNLYRNLGCFEICLKVINLLDSVEEEEDGTLSEQALNTREVCRLCNHLLYWFLLRNPQNQELGYDELSFFIDTLDDEIDSHIVIASIFSMNETLMKRVPQSYMMDMVNKIVVNGKSHHYLTLLGSISHAGDKEISENQFEIIRCLTSPGRLQKVSTFFVPITHPEYQIKRSLMAPLLNGKLDLSLDDLDPLLAYHLMFLEVLSGCTVGRATLTTVEAKVQSVFNFVDIVESILDAGTILICKNKLGMFFYNSIIEVELKIPGLEQSSCVWRLLDSFLGVLNYAKDDVRIVEKLGWEDEQVSRLKIEYIITCIRIAGGFFARYYDPQSFRYNDKSSTTGEKVDISLAQVNDLILALFMKIKDLYDLDSPRLSADTKATIFSALEALNNKASKIIINNLQPNTTLQVATNDALNSEGKLIAKYNEFLDAIEADDEIKKKTETENVAFISLIESLPSVRDKSESDVRYETLLSKLIQSIRDSISIDGEEKRMDSRDTKTATWTVRAFRTMIENKMGMDIYARDEDGGEDEDIAAADVVAALNSCGATTLCLDLIADGIDDALQLEAIRLGTGLLLKNGGALEIQTVMNEYFKKPHSEYFFKQVRLSIQKLQTWHNWNQIIILKEGEEPQPPDEILIVRFLQLMCEGHFTPNQDAFREQPNNKVNYNILDDFVNYLNCLSRLPCRTSTHAACAVADVILEVIQGPCEGNQAHFALNTELIETLNRINRAKVINDCVEDEEVDLKKTSIDIFQGLLEGQGEKSVVYERVLSVIHLDIIQMMSINGTMTTFGEDGQADLSEEQEDLKTQCFVLLQMLCNFKPSLYDELGIPQNVDDSGDSNTAMIEVIWRGDIHRVFFHVPAVCKYLAKSSKDKLVEVVDRSNPENKLIDFLFRSHKLYMEVKHQQLLTEMKLSAIFSRKNQNYATWCTFIIAIVINCLFITYYDGTLGAPKITNKSAKMVIYGLNLAQTIVASFSMLIWLVVRTPVEYQSFKEAGNSQFKTIFLTATEGFTMYYFFYLVLSILGLTVGDYFLPFLLLDIVAKNSTTRDVLNAVIIPWRQLIMTLILCLFLTYIYAFYLFLYYSQDIGGIWGVGVFPSPFEDDCHNVFGCFKFALCYGLRQGGGLSDILNMSINHGRWLLDQTYFLLVTIMLLNIIFGIIIDTFSSLRSDKEARLQDTEEFCFICGIDKQVFDRASEEPDGFQTHIKLDHNMWNYLYFIFLLWEQDRDDDDGIEQYVRRAIAADEIIWFPLNKAIRLDQSASEEEVVLEEVRNKLSVVEDNLTRKLNKFQSELNVLMEQLSAAAKTEFKSGEAKVSIAQYLIQQEGLTKQADDAAESVADAGIIEENGDSLDDEDGDENSLVPDTVSLGDLNTDDEKSVADLDAKYHMLFRGAGDDDESLPNKELGQNEASESEKELDSHLKVHNIETEEDVEEDESDGDEAAEFLQLSNSFAGGKLKIKSISVSNLKSSGLHKKKCAVSVSINGQTFKSDMKVIVKGKKTTWSNLNFFFNSDFNSILVDEMTVSLWNEENEEGSECTNVLRLKLFATHLDTDVDSVLPLIAKSGSQVLKVVVVARFTPVKRLDFHVGDLVKARYLGGKGKWHFGRISADNGDGSYCVDYEDGDYEWNVREGNIERADVESQVPDSENASNVFKFSSGGEL